MTLLIAGTVGAEPERLARALRTCGWAGPTVVAQCAADASSMVGGAEVAILALDSSMPADVEEDRLLEVLAEAGTPTALVACCVDAFPSWPRTLADSRRRLDADRRLPVFATAAGLVEGLGGASGVPELAAWCAQAPDPKAVPRAVDPSASRSGTAGAAAPVVRADRMAGLRAGIVAARAEAASSTRAALSEIAGLVPELCAADGFADWLPRTVDEVERRSRALFLHRLGQVRAAALCGLGSGGALPPPDPVLGAGRATPPPRRGSSAEDLLVLLLGASMGFGVGRMVIAPALAWAGLGVVGTALSIVAGLLLACWAVTIRRAATARARAERWAAETIALRRVGVEQWIGTHAGTAEAHVSREIWSRTRPPRVG